MSFPTIFVLHVSEGYDDRAAHIESMMTRLGLPFEYILRGDKAELTPEVMERFFDPAGELGKPSGATSCAYKHLIACEEIVKRNLDGAFVLEDDIALSDRFAAVALKSLEELPDVPSIINYEDTRLRFVPASMRRKGQVLYPGDRDRFAGALYINRKGAEAILQSAQSEKLAVPIDIYHRRLLDRGTIRYWWSHPCVATQGSHNGAFASTLEPQRGKILMWHIKKAYRKLLYRLR